MARPATILKGTAAVVGAAAVTGLAFWLFRRWDLPAHGPKKAASAPAPKPAAPATP